MKQIGRGWVKSRVVWAAATFFLLGFTWLWTSPPAAGVDEPSHYVRTLGLAHGQLIGREVEVDRPFADFEGQPLRRINAESAWFTIPGRSRAPSACHVLDAARPFDCVQTPPRDGTIDEVSLHGRSLPGSYPIPAVFARFGDGMWSTVMLARFGMLLQNTALFAVIVWALGERRRSGGQRSPAAESLLVVSITPVLVFLAGTLSPSATETLSVGAFTALLFVAARRRSSALMAGAAGLGIFASWSRDLGGPAVVISLVSVVIIEPDLRRWFRETGGTKWLTAGALAGGILGSQIWQAVFKYPLRPEFDSVARVWRDIDLTVTTLRDAIGLGGWLNIRMDPLMQTIWALVWISVCVAVVRRAPALVRKVFVAQILVLFIVSIVLIESLRAARFGTQGRFLMPFVIVSVVCLVMAAPIVEPGTSSPSRWRMASLGGLVAVGHGSLLLVSAHRHARGLNGNPIDFSQAVWSPPGGWWIALALMIVSSLGTGALVSSSPDTAHSHPVGRPRQTGADLTC